jgi:transcription elongation GreA/GreB family factor
MFAVKEEDQFQTEQEAKHEEIIRKTSTLIWRSQIHNSVIVGLTVIFILLSNNEGTEGKVTKWF